MMALLPAILLLGVAGSGMFLPPSNDENETVVRIVTKYVWPIAAINGLMFGLGTYLYLSQGASILFWSAISCAAILTIAEGVAAIFIGKRRL